MTTREGLNCRGVHVLYVARPMFDASARSSRIIIVTGGGMGSFLVTVCDLRYLHETSSSRR